jgi:hypothetical protein
MLDEQFISYIMAKACYNQWHDDNVHFVLDQHDWIFILLSHWNNSLWVDMSLHSDILSWFWANQSLLLLHIAVCLAEKQQITII